MFHWFGVVQNTRGDALGGWQVGLVSVDTQDVVSIFADENSTPILSVSDVANRAVSDEFGNYDFFVPSGTYTLQFYNSAGVFQRSQRFVAMFGADAANSDALASNTGATLVGTASGQDLQEELDGVTASLSLRPTSTTLAASTGSALIGTTGGDTVQDYIDARSISVKDAPYSATGDGVANDAPAFQAAIDALPATGGKLVIPTGTYLLNTEPTFGAKSVNLDIAMDAVFTGAGTGEGKFGYMETNPAQLAVGPYVYSQTKLKSTNSNGGTAAFNVEYIQPTDYGDGQAVGIYAGALARNANAGANTWVANFLHRIEAGALGTHQLLEADVDCFSAGATVKGISLSGAGTANPDKAIELTRVPASGTLWAEGITIAYSQDAFVNTPQPGTRGIVLHGEAGNLVAPFTSTAFSARQYANNADTVFVQRATDTAPTGNVLRAVDAANTTNLALIDVSGNALFQTLTISPAASAVPALNGQLTVEATSNTSLTFRYKGSDGTVRSASLTLA